jgi:hypothetical protein
MSNDRYIEINSTYRNREEWPLTSEFIVPISQTGRKSKENAIDPVCLASPIFCWTSNAFSAAHSGLNAPIPSATVTGTIASVTTPVHNISDSVLLTIKSANPGDFQTLEDYYSRAVIVNTTTGTSKSRIIEYLFLYTTPTNDYAQLIISSFAYTEGDSFSITDPSDFTSNLNSYIFIPAGRLQVNGYTNYLIHNETICQSRPVLTYNIDSGLLCPNTTLSNISTPTSGPLVGWLPTHNYSIRNENPIIPLPGTTYSQISAIGASAPSVLSLPSFTFIPSSSIIILYGDNLNPDLHIDYYRNCGLRIIADGVNNPVTIYNYLFNLANTTKSLPAPINQSRVIVRSRSFTATGGAGLVPAGTKCVALEVNPPFPVTILPTIPANADILPNYSYNLLPEILNFSYDNFNPFVYTGSLVSQQEMVCYEVTLLNLILPNDTLACGEGGRIAFYPFVYVELSNVSASGAGLRNIIYSNNPHSTRVTFRCPINDIPSPLISTFIKIDGDGMSQTIKFKPNDNLYFAVTLYNGELYKTIRRERYAPETPNQACQISAAFSIRRL